jgi:anaerobic selenocysteine-containing dehydrogenase
MDAHPLIPKCAQRYCLLDRFVILCICYLISIRFVDRLISIKGPGSQMTERIQGYCSMCISRCGAIGVVEDGHLVSLEPDPSHPTGKAICAKGRAAPELVHHPDRLLYPLKRTRPKGDPDPGWQQISWEEAMDLTAANLKNIAATHGPESVAFSVSSPSTSATDDSTARFRA